MARKRRMTRALALAGSIAAAIAITPIDATAQAATSPWPEPPRTERLPNGLTLITLRVPSPGIVAYYTVVRTGSRDEVEPGHSGFAHLFEHMMFRGTARFPEDVYEQTIQSLGADNNAFTTNDYTCYTITAPSAALERIVELEADRFQNLTYDETQFRTETGAVRGEYNVWSSDPSLRMDETLSEIAFSRHTYGHTTIGYLRDIEAMPDKFAYSQAFFRRFYTPDNSTIVVAGDVDHDRVAALVRQHYAAWQGQRDRPHIPRERDPRRGALRHVEWDGGAPPRTWIGYRTPAFDGGQRDAVLRRQALRETAALQVVHGIAFDRSGELYQALVVNERSLLALSSWEGGISRDPGLFVIDATLPPGGSFEPIHARIQATLDAIAHGDTPAERIDAVKSHLRYAMVLGLETPEDVASLAAKFIAIGGSLESLNEYLDALTAITPRDVAAAARLYLTPTRRFIVTLAPRAENTATPAAAESEGGAQ